MKLEAATRPTMYFIGVTTGSSSIMKVFPEWVKYLGIDAQIKGIDIAIREKPEVDREVVDFIKKIRCPWVPLLPPTRSTFMRLRTTCLT